MIFSWMMFCEKSAKLYFPLAQYTRYFPCLTLLHTQYNLMSIALDFSCQMLLFANPSLVALSVTTGVRGCWWLISSREILKSAPH